MRNVLSHWSSVRFLGIGLSSPCKVARHSKTVSCSAAVLSIDTFCVRSDLLITCYHCPYLPPIVGPAWKLPAFVCILHASSWPLSCEFVWPSCSLIHATEISTYFFNCDILKNWGWKVCFCQVIQWRPLTLLYTKNHTNTALIGPCWKFDFITHIFHHFLTTMIVEICTLLRCYAACSCNFPPTFWDNLWVPSWPLKMEPIGCPETSARDCHYTLRNIPEEPRSLLFRGRSVKSTISTIPFTKEHTLRK
jgi:hypothetical protein